MSTIFITYLFLTCTSRYIVYNEHISLLFFLLLLSFSPVTFICDNQLSIAFMFNIPVYELIIFYIIQV